MQTNITSKIIFPFLGFLFLSLSAHSQSIWLWSKTGLSFNGPDDLEIREYSEETFQMDNEEFLVLIYKEALGKTTKGTLQNFLKDEVKKMKMTTDSLPYTKLNKLTGLWGVTVGGVFDEVGCLLSAYLDKKGKALFIALVCYTGNNKTKALDMVKSFTYL